MSTLTYPEPHGMRAAGAPAGDADDEVRLVELVRVGDARAFAVLYDRYGRLVERVARDHVHDAESVADVAQEVFTRALERLATLRDPSRFRPWLLAITRNAAIDYRRRVQHAPGSTADPPELRATDPGPDELVELGELGELVRSCVAGLSIRDATAVAMVTYLGFSSAEIAGALGLTPNAAKVVVHRARARLRQALGLQLLARRRLAPCDAFVTLFESGELLAAARHTDRCKACSAAVEVEVAAYDHTSTAHASAYGPRADATSSRPTT